MKKVKLFVLAMMLSIQAMATTPLVTKENSMTLVCKVMLDKDEFMISEEINFVKLSVMQEILAHISESDFSSPQAWHIEYHAIAWVKCSTCNVYYNAFEGGCKNANCQSKMN
jgi:hypothetical protein